MAEGVTKQDLQQAMVDLKEHLSNIVRPIEKRQDEHSEYITEIFKNRDLQNMRINEHSVQLEGIKVRQSIWAGLSSIVGGVIVGIGSYLMSIAKTGGK